MASRSEWRWKFAWLPLFLNNDHCVWFGWYERRMVTIADGHHAAGQQRRWMYRTWKGEFEGDVFH